MRPVHTAPHDLPVTTNPPANPQNLPTQSLPHRGRCPEGAEGVAAEHASNHRPSGESAKALSALRAPVYGVHATGMNGLYSLRYSQRERQGGTPFGAGTESPKALHLGEHHRYSLRSLPPQRLRGPRSQTNHFYTSCTNPSGVRA